MKIDVLGNHIEVTEAIETYVEEKVGRIERITTDIDNVNVILVTEHNKFKASGTLRYKGHQVHVDVETDNMYKSIDSMATKLGRSVRKHKESDQHVKGRTHRHE